jgi:hypothetical protein
MRRVVVSTVCVAIVLAAALTGCSGSAGLIDEQMSLDDAKKLAQEMEREIVQSLPPGVATNITQQEKGTLLSCSPDGARQWAGGLTATIIGDRTPDDVIGAIAESFAGRDDLSVSRRENQGDSLVTLYGTDQSVWVVRYIRSRAELDVDSGSPCIRLPDDVWPGGSY